ncbi:energy transducer TonB [Arenimonas caeni]|uniref:Energy transducer TonB n=1 Tax=Arenimonas caeni TaxID=2058085 RepID=A0A2P6MA71_9GAMM|nr:energy transducer TonB [Arenimonas caeni]PRH82896.1 energy transducer TonB [Arenimonas caeni]
MVRSLPHPSSVPPLARLDAKRVAGNTLAIAVHLVVLGLLMLPSSWSPPAGKPKSDPTIVLFEPAPRPEIPATVPPPLPVQQVQPQPQSPPVRLTPTVPAASDAPVFENGEIFSPPDTDTGAAQTSFDPGPPSLMTLAYDVAPAPRYPREALRAGHEGTVMLRVLVDEAGRPVEVSIEASSGHRELDRVARLQVLERWRFHPAQRGGRAVAAYALVPVVFRLP